VRIGKRTIVDVSSDTVDEARAFFAGLELEGAARQIAAEVIKEIRGRLDFLARSASATSRSIARARRSRAASRSGSGSRARSARS
jgi:excinuclease ABC subunit A